MSLREDRVSGRVCRGNTQKGSRDDLQGESIEKTNRKPTGSHVGGPKGDP